MRPYSEKFPGVMVQDDFEGVWPTYTPHDLAEIMKTLFPNALVWIAQRPKVFNKNNQSWEVVFHVSLPGPGAKTWFVHRFKFTVYWKILVEVNKPTKRPYEMSRMERGPKFAEDAFDAEFESWEGIIRSPSTIVTAAKKAGLKSA